MGSSHPDPRRHCPTNGAPACDATTVTLRSGHSRCEANVDVQAILACHDPLGTDDLDWIADWKIGTGVSIWIGITLLVASYAVLAVVLWLTGVAPDIPCSRTRRLARDLPSPSQLLQHLDMVTAVGRSGSAMIAVSLSSSGWRGWPA